jgi:pimeloyl-ACP methyl ester carboxylesterase
MQEDRVEVAPGVELGLRRWETAPPEGAPPGSAVPFLLVHGLSSNARTWDGVAAVLAASGHPVVAVDQRGHGRSDTPGTGYDVPTVAADLAVLIDRLGLGRPVVAGQSWGGNVVLQLAVDHPSAVRGIVCVDGGLIELAETFPDWDACAEALAPPPIDGMRAVELEARIRSAHPDWSDAGVSATMGNFAVRPDGTVSPNLSRERHMTVLHGLWEHRPSAVLDGLRVPAIFVLADTDDADWTATKRAAAERAVAAVPAARVRWFAHADHDIHVQRPDELAGVMLDALADGFFR